MNSPVSELPAQTEVITGAHAKRGPVIFNIINLVTIAIPTMLTILWLGLSIVLYAMYKHHPNPKTGHYITWAGYRLYAIGGAAIPVATFFPVELIYWLVYWAVSALVMIPWTIYDLIKIKKDTWEDIVITKGETL